MNLEFEENITRRGARKRAHTEAANSGNFQAMSTSRCTIMSLDDPKTPCRAFEHKNEQTPRRSGRKSIKPVQDYDEIVNGLFSRTLRSSKNEMNFLGTQSLEEDQPKWTPAKVGRVSEKRTPRRSAKKSKSLNHQKSKQTKIIKDLELKNTQEGENEIDPLEDNDVDVVAKTDDVLDTTFDNFEKGKSVEKSLAEKTDLVCFAPIVYGAEDVVIIEDAQKSSSSVQTEASECIEIDDSINSSEQIKNVNTTIKNDECYKNTSSTCSNELELQHAQLSQNELLVECAPANVDLTEEVEKCSKNDNKLHSHQKLSSDEDQEMPSLILCDDDEDLGIEKLDIINCKSDETFNAGNCVIMSPTNDKVFESLDSQHMALSEKHVDSPLAEAEKKVKELQSKYFTPNRVKTPVLRQKIVCFAEETKPESVAIRKTPRNDERNTVGISTPLSNRSKTGYRFPTPFKTKKDFNFSGRDKENVTQNLLHSPNSQMPIITTLEPREIVLRSIRKRSSSVTLGEQHKRKALNVTFYSPANQTTTTEDLDKLISKNGLETDGKDHQIKPNRKRSISLDDNALRFPSKLPIRMKSSTKIPKSPSKLLARTKLPNFAAIHEKQFQRMENLVDYVARKAERAQNLTNSASKSQNASFLKGTSSKSPQNVKPLRARALPLASSSTKETSTDKLTKRRERHVAMFKSRTELQTGKKQNNNEFIKGVRSNRRFELLMQHRKNSGH